jgi:hypothetical protein
LSRRRAGAATPTALSFSRTAMRELVRGRWRIEKDRIELDAEGRGEILYRLVGHGWTFHFFLISTKLPEEQKLDRNFAQSWDAMGLLCQGAWTPEREARLRVEIPKQRAGRADYDTLMYARGNRSGRLFDHVVESLAAGRQPDVTEIARVGYILRTTAFIGNGQLGTRPLAGFEPGHPMRRPYHAQIWSAFMLREYVFDLVDHMARARNPAAARLDPAYRRYLGLGNSAATGLVHFLGTHPCLIDRWCGTTERALAEARAQEVAPGSPAAAAFERLIGKAIRYFREGRQEPDLVFADTGGIADDLVRVAAAFRGRGADARQPWLALHDWIAHKLGAETLEVFDAIVLELYPAIVDRHAEEFLADERLAVDPAMTLRALADLLRARYDWAPADAEPDASYFFWYRSRQAPRDVRRGIRALADGFDRESPVDVTLRVRDLEETIGAFPPETPVAELLSRHPRLRHIVARVQSPSAAAYGELRVDYLSRLFSPFEPIRFLLSFYGMEKFESAPPKSVRGAFLQGAPIAEDVAAGVDGDWPFPLIPRQDRPAGARQAVAPGVDVAPPPATEGDAASGEALTVAPIELHRLAQGALHGSGVPLGVAEHSAGHVVFAQAVDGGGVETLLRHLERGVRDVEAPAIVASAPSVYVLDAHGASALLAAPSTLDLAVAKAARDKAGAVLVRGAVGGAAIADIVLDGAERGLLALLTWDDGQPGFALAAPSAPAPWFMRGTLPRRAPLHAALCRDPSGVPWLSGWRNAHGGAALVDAAARSLRGHGAPDASDGEPGLTLLCRTLDASEAGDVLFDALAQRLAAALRLRWSGSDTAAHRAAWQRRGLSLSQRQFAAIVAADARTLVPAEEEHRLRPDEGTDPLRVF